MNWMDPKYMIMMVMMKMMIMMMMKILVTAPNIIPPCVTKTKVNYAISPRSNRNKHSGFVSGERGTRTPQQKRRRRPPRFENKMAVSGVFSDF